MKYIEIIESLAVQNVPKAKPDFYLDLDLQSFLLGNKYYKFIISFIQHDRNFQFIQSHYNIL
jgi:hypothetical protein